MNKILKAPIIFSLLAVSAFSVIGSEPSRAGNKVVKVGYKCSTIKTGKNEFKVKNSRGQLFHTNSNKQAAIDWMKNSPNCCNNTANGNPDDCG